MPIRAPNQLGTREAEQGVNYAREEQEGDHRGKPVCDSVQSAIEASEQSGKKKGRGLALRRWKGDVDV